MEPRETTWSGSEKMDAPTDFPSAEAIPNGSEKTDVPTDFPSAEPSSLPDGKMAPDGISVDY